MARTRRGEERREPVPVAQALHQLAADLIEDYHALRAGRLTVRDARARATLAREAMRAVHLQFEGMRFLTEQAKLIGNGKGEGV